MNIKRYFLLSSCLLALSGCFTQSSFETPPVTVRTAQGPVTCQLYLRDRVVLDTAIAFPNVLTKEQADQVCIDEGTRQLQQRRSG